MSATTTTTTSTTTSTESEAFAVVTSAYYRNRDAQLATMALRHWLRMVAAADDDELQRMMVLFYVFARISQVSAEARDAFAPLLRAYEGPHADLAQQLLRAATDPAFPSALALPIEGPGSLDLLWAEYFVTGDAAPIERIVTTLDWSDCVRERFEAWLHETSLLGGGKRRDAAATLATAGIAVDLERKTITSPGDLDCLVFSIAERRIPIFQMLPFELTQAELTTLATKASAVWSLRLNARDHADVAAICRTEAQRAGGPARQLIAEAAGAAPPFAL